jgi:hypothetical protein
MKNGYSYNHKTITTKTKLLFVISYIILITLFDSYSYGIIYQQKIKQEGYSNHVWSWVFKESGDEVEGGIVTVPRYRIIQKIVEITGLIIVSYFCGVWCTAGLLIAHYLLSFDLLFYIVLDQTDLFTFFEKNNLTYWLRYGYQAGYFLLNPFSAVRFYIMGLSGIAIALMTCFIPYKNAKNINSVKTAK